jgi:hypothetical protein
MSDYGRPSLLMQFAISCQINLTIMGSWMQMWEDVIPSDAFYEMFREGMGIPYDEVAEMAHLLPKVVFTANTNGGSYADIRVETIASKIHHLKEVITERSHPMMSPYVFALGVLYPVEDVLTLSDAEVKQALRLAATNPGKVSWNDILLMISEGVDDELMRSLLG